MPGLKLVAELGGDGSGFDAMMRRATASKDKFGAAFGGLKNAIAGAFTVGAIASLSRQTIDFASHLNDVSDALRVNVEWFQKRANAARLAGGSEDDLFKFIDTMTKNRADAVQNPQGDQAKAFGRLGFSGSEISGLNTMDFFDKLVKAFADGANKQTDVDAEKVGGRTARKLLAAFHDGFQSDASVMGADLVNALDEIGDTFTTLKYQLMVEFAPAIKWVADIVVAAVNQIRQAGAFLGGFSANMTMSDLIQLLTNPAGFLGKESAKTLRGKQNTLSDGAIEAISLDADQRNLADALALFQKKRREAREKANRGAPGFDDPDEKPEKEKHSRGGPAIPTDALVGIGNFLGRNGSLVNSVADQTLQVARLHLAATNNVKQEIINLALKLAPGTGGTLGIPGA